MILITNNDNNEHTNNNNLTINRTQDNKPNNTNRNEAVCLHWAKRMTESHEQHAPKQYITTHNHNDTDHTNDNNDVNDIDNNDNTNDDINNTNDILLLSIINSIQDNKPNDTNGNEAMCLHWAKRMTIVMLLLI